MRISISLLEGGRVCLFLLTYSIITELSKKLWPILWAVALCRAATDTGEPPPPQRAELGWQVAEDPPPTPVLVVDYKLKVVYF